MSAIKLQVRIKSFIFISLMKKLLRLFKNDEGLKKAHSLPYLIRIATSLQTYYNVVSCIVFIPHPPWKKVGDGGGYTEIALSICPDVCLCRFVPAHIFSLLWHWLTIVGTWVYHHEMMCHVHSWSWYYFNLWPQCQIIRVFNMSLCLASNLFYCFDIGLITIFGSWVYLHERMCRVQLWYWCKADLWPQGQIYKVFDMLWPQFYSPLT